MPELSGNDILTRTGEVRYDKVVEIRVPGCGLSRIVPTQFHKLVNLELLDASNNQLPRLPFDELSQPVCPKLHTLELSNNNLAFVDGICKVKSLQHVNLTGNLRISPMAMLQMPFVLPNLQTLNGQDVTDLRTQAQAIAAKVVAEMRTVWREYGYENKLARLPAARVEELLVENAVIRLRVDRMSQEMRMLFTMHQIRQTAMRMVAGDPETLGTAAATTPAAPPAPKPKPVKPTPVPSSKASKPAKPVAADTAKAAAATASKASPMKSGSSTPGRHACSVCARSFLGATALARHVQKEHGDAKTPTKHTGDIFDSDDSSGAATGAIRAKSTPQRTTATIGRVKMIMAMDTDDSDDIIARTMEGAQPAKRKPAIVIGEDDDDEDLEEIDVADPAIRAKHARVDDAAAAEAPAPSGPLSQAMLDASTLHTPIKATTKPTQPLDASNFELTHMLRAHGSQDLGLEDSTTHVWACAFAPHVYGEHVVATCGGNAVCLIDAALGKVLMKYTHLDEDFYCVAWTVLPGQVVILAAAGTQADIKLIDPAERTCYLQFPAHDDAINSLAFHPTRPALLLSGTEGGVVQIHDIGDRAGASASTLWTFNTKKYIASVACAPSGSGFFVGGENMLIWFAFARGFSKSSAPVSTHVRLDPGTGFLDDILFGSDNLALCKINSQGAVVAYERQGASWVRAHALAWPQCDQFYIRGCLATEGTLVAGDHEGKIHFLPDAAAKQRTGHRSTIEAPCDANTARFAAVSRDGQYLVAGYDANLVAIWASKPRAA
eukprot:m.18834 g.18834  ORF g.18834 m.18834 type:complete len:777 (+) comp3376_c0_seq1:40-2370(+)